jgi:hypothetical protein
VVWKQNLNLIQGIQRSRVKDLEYSWTVRPEHSILSAFDHTAYRVIIYPTTRLIGFKSKTKYI